MATITALAMYNHGRRPRMPEAVRTARLAETMEPETLNAPAPGTAALNGAPPPPEGAEAVIAVQSRPYPDVQTLLARVEPPLSPVHAERVRAAYALAERSHAGQKRRSGDPYFAHCVEVALLTAEQVRDWATLAAALLHDTIEDCGLTTKIIQAHVPDPVAELVDGVTKISSLNFSSDREHQATNLRKMILAMARDVRVVIIKLCDRLHNMRTLEHLAPERQREIATSTLELYAPLATRLGTERICHELEDLALRYLNPTFYRQIAGHLERNRERYQAIIDRARTILETELRRATIRAAVTGRVKHLYSIYRKMLRQGLRLNEVHDLIAMRIVTPTLSEAYEALGVVHARWKPVEGRFKDYIATPKPNGYQAIHTTVLGLEGELTEIQIRTEQMHRAATEGIAAHWNYKEDGSLRSPAAVEAQKLAWLRQLVEALSEIRDPQEFMAAVKHDVFSDSVFCYTPQGDVIELPRGSSVLDFAFRIHSEVGFRCAGARINHKMAPLKSTLQTGHIVEILTAKTAHPTRDWLQIAHTARARNKIRHWLKTHDRPYYLDRGRAIFIEELRHRAPEIAEAAAIKQLNDVAPAFSLAGGEDVLVEIGFGAIKPGAVIHRLAPAPTTPAKEPPPRRPRRPSPPGTILVEGMPGALTRMARCCGPGPGDPILGFVTQGRGISVHRTDCPSLRRSQELHADAPNRIVRVEWSDGSERLLRATIRLLCQDRHGLLKDITQTISQMGIGITHSHSDSNFKTGMAIVKMTVMVRDEDLLNRLLKRLQEVPSIRSVTRVLHHGSRRA